MYCQILRVSENALSSVKSLGKLRRLEELYVAGNRVSDTSHVVTLFPDLHILDVACNHLETWEQVVRTFVTCWDEGVQCRVQD